MRPIRSQCRALRNETCSTKILCRVFPDNAKIEQGQCRIQTLRWGGGGIPKKLFLALRASIWSKIKGGEGARPPGPSPGSATEGKEGLCCQCEDNRTGCLKLGFSKNVLTREHYEFFKKRLRISLTVRHLLLQLKTDAIMDTSSSRIYNRVWEGAWNHIEPLFNKKD